jgi:hypothetical protein
MKSLSERYRQGERLQVWQELVDSGASIREEPLYQEALTVANIMMRRSRYNIERIVHRLTSIGYTFVVETDSVFAIPNKATLSVLDTIETHCGLLPLVIRSWFEIVGEVCLMGSHPRLSQYLSLEQNPSHPQGPATEPMVVVCDAVPYVMSYRDEGYELSTLFTQPYFFSIGPDADHKAGYSGGADIGVQIPNLAFDAMLTEGDHKVMYFIQYLHQCFQYGGFPGFAHAPIEAKKSHSELKFLTKGLLSLL